MDGSIKTASVKLQRHCAEQVGLGQVALRTVAGQQTHGCCSSCLAAIAAAAARPELTACASLSSASGSAASAGAPGSPPAATWAATAARFLACFSACFCFLLCALSSCCCLQSAMASWAGAAGAAAAAAGAPGRAPSWLASVLAAPALPGRAGSTEAPAARPGIDNGYQQYRVLSWIGSQCMDSGAVLLALLGPLFAAGCILVGTNSQPDPPLKHEWLPNCAATSWHGVEVHALRPWPPAALSWAYPPPW